MIDKIKIPSKPAFLNVLACDLVKNDISMQHVASRPNGFVEKWKNFHNGNPPFLFILNFLVPVNMNFVIYMEVPENPDPKYATVASLLQRFMHEDDDSFRDSRFKVIPKVREGGWIIKRGVGSTPGITGNKGLRQTYYSGSHYFEIDLDVGSSGFASRILKLVKSYIKQISLDIAFVIQGNAKSELPEALLAAITVQYLDLDALLPWSNDEDNEGNTS